MTSEAKDHIRPAGGSEHVDDLGGRTMTSAADQHMGVGPVAPQIRQQPDQEHGLFGPGGRVPGRREAATRACDVPSNMQRGR